MLIDRAMAEDIQQCLEEQGILQEVRLGVNLEAIDPEYLYEGKLGLLEHELVLQVRVPASLHSKPAITIKEGLSIIIPHVDERGVVCYLDEQGLLFDLRQPVKVVLEAVERAVGLLQSGLDGEGPVDFVEEWQRYWETFSQETYQLVDMPTDEQPREVVLVPAVKSVKNQRGVQGWIGSTAEQVHQYLKHFRIRGKGKKKKLLYLPLSPTPVPVPPNFGQFWTAEQALAFLRSRLPEDFTHTHAEILRRRQHNNTEELVLSLPRADRSKVFFGLRFKNCGGTHPLLQESMAGTVEAISIERRDAAFLLERGGANHVLEDARVLLIGCGAVGGFFAENLVQAGVQRIDFVDKDFYRPENSHRHVLGQIHWDVAKAEALQRYLQAKYPNVKARAQPHCILHLLRKQAIDPTRYHLIVVAVGDPVLEMLLNREWWHQDAMPPILHTWLEPLGLGGHAVLVRPGQCSGCFQCLFTPLRDDEDQTFRSRVAFAAPGQSFSRTIAGCAGRFTPYAASAAVHTALLAAELATDVLSGTESGSPLRSWKGSDRTFQQMGFITTVRYQQPADALRQVEDFGSDACAICTIVSADGHDSA